MNSITENTDTALALPAERDTLKTTITIQFPDFGFQNLYPTKKKLEIFG